MHSFHMMVRRNQGFTLIEVLLVIGLIVLLAAIVTPAWQGQIASHELNSSARDVQTFLKLARITAIESGQETTVEYALGGSSLRAYPTRSRQMVVHSLAGTTTSSKSSTHVRNTPELEVVVTVNVLPDTIQLSEDGSIDLSSIDLEPKSPQDENRASGNTSEFSEFDLDSELEWKTLAVFSPDGRSRNGVVGLSHSGNNQALLVHLRGVTGSVRIERIIDASQATRINDTNRQSK